MSKVTDEMIAQFVKATKDEKETKKETTVSGTVAIRDNKTYVQLDGSELLTPATTTANVKDGERVMVMIKNHSAIIMGNTTSPSASTGDVAVVNDKVTAVEKLVAGSISAEELNVERARIDELEADNVTINKTLSANSVSIETLEADNVTINKTLTANSASIETLEADNVTINKTLTALEVEVENMTASEITTEFLNTHYANIELSNIDIANIGTLFANVGLITKATIVDGHITGFLDAVEVNANSITAGTLSVDRLIFRGTENSIIYELNNITDALQAVQGNTLNGEILTERSITVDKIVANSITANELNVADIFGNSAVLSTLVAQDAFINAISTNSVVVGAKNMAQQADSKADAAHQVATSVGSTANNTAAIVEPWVYDNTYINGAMIGTGTILANSIAAGAITADKLSVDDLGALNATIGNWVINDAELSTTLNISAINHIYTMGIRAYSPGDGMYDGGIIYSSYSTDGGETFKDAMSIDISGCAKFKMVYVNSIKLFDPDADYIVIDDPLECGGGIRCSDIQTTSGASLNTINSNLGQKTEGQFILPNGLKICWGWVGTTNVNGYFRRGTVTFPVTYTNPPTIFTTDWIYNQDSIDARVITSVRSYSTTGCILMAKDPSGGIADRNVDINWIAIGY